MSINVYQFEEHKFGLKMLMSPIDQNLKRIDDPKNEEDPKTENDIHNEENQKMKTSKNLKLPIT